jgi:hypothetical protein
MSDKMITEREYWSEVKAIQKNLLDEYKQEGADTDPNEWVNDRMHETIDGHQWIIYTYYNTQVLTHSKNDDAYFEEFGPLEATGFSDAVAKMAYAALYADVMDDFDLAPFEKAYEKANR